MLNLSVFENPRFSAASFGLMLIFFAMFGATFLLTQYLQSIMGFSRAEGRRRAAAVGRDHARASRHSSARLAERFGTEARRRHRPELRDALARC